MAGIDRSGQQTQCGQGLMTFTCVADQVKIFLLSSDKIMVWHPRPLHADVHSPTAIVRSRTGMKATAHRCVVHASPHASPWFKQQATGRGAAVPGA
ncbi:hypothetical protein BXU06_11960 [Aquaspirillum sp. LM1]|nr:hypothetical protein BXU06_11960 [Aquaspirillum sp. LM1]